MYSVYILKFKKWYPLKMLRLEESELHRQHQQESQIRNFPAYHRVLLQLMLLPWPLFWCGQRIGDSHVLNLLSINWVYLTLVGNNSAPRQSSALKPIVDTPPKTQERIKFPEGLLMTQIRKAANPATTILKTATTEISYNEWHWKKCRIVNGLDRGRICVQVYPCEIWSIYWLVKAKLPRWKHWWKHLY